MGHWKYVLTLQNNSFINDPTMPIQLQRVYCLKWVCQIFTKLDASNAYWQIELDEESSKLLTFNSPFCR